MLFDEPIEFEEAVKSNRARALLPTNLSFLEMSRIKPQNRKRALWSARTANAAYLQDLQDILDKVIRPTQDDAGTTKGMSTADARLAAKDALEKSGYLPKPGEEGTIKDLSSDQRINLIIETQVQMATGYGNWQQGQSRLILDQFPAQELYRASNRVEPRDWPTIWAESGGRFIDGRMIARKDDDIWTRISRFGTPYPPFDFNSGMDVRDIDREFSEQNGLIQSWEEIIPEQRDLDQDMAVPVTLGEDLTGQLLKDLGPGYDIKGGILTHA